MIRTTLGCDWACAGGAQPAARQATAGSKAMTSGRWRVGMALSLKFENGWRAAWRRTFHRRAKYNGNRLAIFSWFDGRLPEQLGGSGVAENIRPYIFWRVIVLQALITPRSGGNRSVSRRPGVAAIFPLLLIAVVHSPLRCTRFCARSPSLLSIAKRSEKRAIKMAPKQRFSKIVGSAG